MAARDPYTVGHQRRVSRIACSIGRAMGLSEDRLRDLRMAGTLHDLGKIAIPSGLLSKPGDLTSLEFALVKTHPEVAYNILEPISLPGNTAEIILQHHERLDGSGYPKGLQEDEILPDANILGVADVMEAMCSHRPYRASLGLPETLDELSRNRGILYSAAVVETCLKLYGQDVAAPPGLNRRICRLRFEAYNGKHYLSMGENRESKKCEPDVHITTRAHRAEFKLKPFGLSHGLK